MNFTAKNFRAIALRNSTATRSAIANDLLKAAVDGRGMAIINGHQDRTCPYLLVEWLKENEFRTEIDILESGEFIISVYW